MAQIQAEQENLNLHISTLSQQIDLFQHASNRAKEEQGKMRYKQKRHYLCCSFWMLYSKGFSRIKMELKFSFRGFRSA